MDLVLESMIASRADMGWATVCLELMALGVPVGSLLREREGRGVASDHDHHAPTWTEAMATAKHALGEDAWQVDLCAYALRLQWGLEQPAYERRLQKDALSQKLSWLVTGERAATT